ncbi:MAG: DUF4331 domain-containing protein [Gammaproteobacteria bacterium]|nr:DUF4331 domain-containing protein [Gammaproteobacteria bacterium]
MNTLKPLTALARPFGRRLGLMGATALLGLAAVTPAFSASHSDAPLIKQDPQANITDVYAFVGNHYNDAEQQVLNVVVHVRPFSEPGDGVIYDRFSDDALYSIHLTDPASGQTVLRYNFEFSDATPTTTPGLKNPNTILSYGLGTDVGPILTIGQATQNFTQTYRVTQETRRSKVRLGSMLPVAPPNVGNNVTPLYNDSAGDAISGAATLLDLDSYTQQAISDLRGSAVSFAGPRDDGFYADTPAIFDLLDARIINNDGDDSDGLGQDGGGVDGFKGFNVLAYGLQIPLGDLAEMGSQVGVYASVSRRRVTIRTRNGDPKHQGGWVQVNRMGNPLFNEVFVALQDKDNYNRSSPTTDRAMFENYALNPELGALVNFVFGTSIPTTNRSDLASIFIPDVLRVDLTTGPVPLAGQSNFDRLSVFGNDLTNGAPSGFPNGRRFGDDVVDIALTALAQGTLIGDNVAANDQLFHQVFPYSATPHAGPRANMRQAPANTP